MQQINALCFLNVNSSRIVSSSTLEAISFLSATCKQFLTKIQTPPPRLASRSHLKTVYPWIRISLSAMFMFNQDSDIQRTSKFNFDIRNRISSILGKRLRQLMWAHLSPLNCFKRVLQISYSLLLWGTLVWVSFTCCVMSLEALALSSWPTS